MTRCNVSVMVRNGKERNALAFLRWPQQWKSKHLGFCRLIRNADAKGSIPLCFTKRIKYLRHGAHLPYFRFRVSGVTLRRVALISATFFFHLIIFYPVTSDLSAWYAADFVLALIICLALIGFGFYTSLPGQPLFRGALPDD